jgi:hypothetical protein
MTDELERIWKTWRDWGKWQKTSIKITSVPDKNKTKNLPYDKPIQWKILTYCFLLARVQQPILKVEAVTSNERWQSSIGPEYSLS